MPGTLMAGVSMVEKFDGELCVGITIAYSSIRTGRRSSR